MTDARPEPKILTLARQARVVVPFELRPGPEARAGLAADLGIEAVRKLRLEGTLTPEGSRDWRLDARLGATVVQPCVVTLAPVTTRIDTDVTRRYRADWQEPGLEETEMPEDDTAEPLPDRIDLSEVLAEALALALPDYPRAPGADLGSAQFAAPGVAPMTDDEARPLAGLAALRDRLRDGVAEDDDDDGDEDGDGDADGNGDGRPAG